MQDIGGIILAGNFFYCDFQVFDYVSNFELVVYFVRFDWSVSECLQTLKCNCIAVIKIISLLVLFYMVFIFIQNFRQLQKIVIFEVEIVFFFFNNEVYMLIVD